MDIFWWIVTGLVVVAVIASWYILAVRGDLVHRANRATPEDAAALREVQRQIDAGYSHSDRARFDSNF
jgi:hypothetical protein